ncbi:MAG: hypothetical protein CSA96_09820 [Bacteroidetes bacterium]|nr:MAG: hypothetical protein CSA96_09820 [Bacteroidota bacterium]
MKSFSLILFAMLLLPSSVLARTDSADSLMQRIPVASGNELAHIYYELAQIMIDSMPDSALHFVDRSERILARYDPDGLLPFLYMQKGEIYEKKHRFDRSLSHYRKAYESFVRSGNQAEIASSAWSLGGIYYELADFSQAYYFFMTSRNAAENRGDEHGMALMENNLGNVAHEMEKYSEAEQHYKNALTYYRENKLLEEECMAMNNLGLIRLDRQDYDSARVYFNEVLGKLENSGIPINSVAYVLSGVYNNIALSLIEEGGKREVLPYLEKGLRLARMDNDLYTVATVYLNMGSIYTETDLADSALYFLHRTTSIAQELGYKDLLIDAYDELACLHAGLGNYASAYNWRVRYDSLNREVYNENQTRQINQLRVRYEQEIREKKIAGLQAKTKAQRSLNKVYVIVIILVLALVVIVAINLRDKKVSNTILAERNIQISDAIRRISDSENKLKHLNTSKDKIFSVVAHDLRNPVAAISGFAELLNDGFDEFDTEIQKDYIMQIFQASQRMQSLLENLLVWARSQMKAIKCEPELLSLWDVTNDCYNELLPNIEYKKVAVENRVLKNCTVYADESMLRTIIRNLLMNAVKFSFPGGRILISSSPAGAFCVLSVRDQGIGIRPEVRDKLFSPNEMNSTPGTSGEAGSGLGLILCKEFTEKNGGRIWLESEDGKGSVFRVELPRIGH